MFGSSLIAFIAGARSWSINAAWYCESVLLEWSDGAFFVEMETKGGSSSRRMEDWGNSEVSGPLILRRRRQEKAEGGLTIIKSLCMSYIRSAWEGFEWEIDSNEYDFVSMEYCCHWNYDEQ
ncbi:RINT1-like protein MAG2 [Iris pallida]|uniref:RINT1-like protein MAG2 n=1 Tax=Iris pallida TaxID=29817 RepID=A0AAX6GP80_IRIPA|nr:RINT1-like protein MAG2 [Iris pallida]